jgi:hypothetical protein
MPSMMFYGIPNLRQANLRKKTDGSRCMEATFFGDVWAVLLV